MCIRDRYSDPECAGLKEILAKRYGMKKSNIYVSNGSDDILNFAFMAFAGGRTEVLFPEISYGFYQVFADLYLSLIHISIFTGIAQGIQPLVSDYYGRNLTGQLTAVLKDAVIVAFALTAVIVAVSNIWSEGIVSLFNKSGDLELQSIAKEGIKIYFLGFFPGSINIVLAGYLSAMERAEKGFIISLLRLSLIHI